MKPRAREPNSPGRPTPPWFAGIVIGITISTLAAGAMMLGTGMAIGQAIARPK
jgi:hypothetical protein